MEKLWLEQPDLFLLTIAAFDFILFIYIIVKVKHLFFKKDVLFTLETKTELAAPAEITAPTETATPSAEAASPETVEAPADLASNNKIPSLELLPALEAISTPEEIHTPVPEELPQEYEVPHMEMPLVVNSSTQLFDTSVSHQTPPQNDVATLQNTALFVVPDTLPNDTALFTMPTETPQRDSTALFSMPAALPNDTALFSVPETVQQDTVLFAVPEAQEQNTALTEVEVATEQIAEQETKGDFYSAELDQANKNPTADSTALFEAEAVEANSKASTDETPSAAPTHESVSKKQFDFMGAGIATIVILCIVTIGYTMFRGEPVSKKIVIDNKEVLSINGIAADDAEQLKVLGASMFRPNDNPNERKKIKLLVKGPDGELINKEMELPIVPDMGISAPNPEGK